VIAIRTGDWPQRLHDVEEMEVLALRAAQTQQDAEAAR
jgi:hypothetical protein